VATVNCGGWSANRGVRIIPLKLEELGTSPKEQEGAVYSNSLPFPCRHPGQGRAGQGYTDGREG
jgi:hypothetical protein